MMCHTELYSFLIATTNVKFQSARLGSNICQHLGNITGESIITKIQNYLNHASDVLRGSYYKIKVL